MNDPMNVSLPDLSAYLDRIGIDSPEVPTLAFLDRLIFAHQTHIPFEDLDPWHFKKVPSLDIPDLFEKLVIKKRGGFCFEQNLFFTQALKDLGFDAYTAFSRVVYKQESSYIPPCRHCVVIVRLADGLHLCDVGYGGPQPPLSVPLPGERAMEITGESWKIEPKDEHWFTVYRKNSEGQYEYTLQFNLFRQVPQEFLPICYWCAASPEAVFTNSLRIGLRTETGSKSINDNIYVERTAEARIEKKLDTWEETLRCLAQEFGIEI